MYRRLAAETDYALHLGLTEAGMGMKGTVASTAGLSVLLLEGIGDTIRASLTPTPNGDRREEVLVCQQILQSLEPAGLLATGHVVPGLRANDQQLLPGAGGAGERAAARADARLARALPRLGGAARRGHGVRGERSRRVEARGHRDLAPGTGEHPKAPVYVDGALRTTLSGPRIAEEFLALVDDYVASRFGDS